MKWNFSPMALIKALTVVASVFTMCMTPVAEGAKKAASNKELINRYLKATNLSGNKKITMGQYWTSVRGVYPVAMQKAIDEWMKNNKNQPMPKIEASTFKDKDGKEQVRLNLTKDGQVVVLTFTGDEEVPLKINSTPIKKKELLDYNNFNSLLYRVTLADPSFKKGYAKNAKGQKRFLKGKEIANMPMRKQIDYLLKMRQAVEAADRVLELSQPKSGASFEQTHPGAEYVLQLLLGNQAEAFDPKTTKNGLECVASGWIASYHQGSCARANPGRDTLLKQVGDLPFNDGIRGKVSSCATAGGLPCNPLLFGFSDNEGSPICIKKDLKTATAQCNRAAPLPSSKEKIIQTIVSARLQGKGGLEEKAKDGSLCKISGDDTVSKSCAASLERYTDELEQHYLRAAEFCTKKGYASITAENSWVTRTDIKTDQVDACENLKDRFFSLKVETEVPPPPPIPTPIPECKEGDKDCGNTGGGGEIVDEGEIPGAAQPPPPGKTEDDDKCDSWYCNIPWGPILGIGLGVGIFWWMLKDNDKINTPTYVPPVDTCDLPKVVVNGLCTTPGSTCTAPYRWVNGVCTPPEVQPPPVIPPTTTEGGTTVDEPGRAGGTR